jgi:6-phosphogluconolactonase
MNRPSHGILHTFGNSTELAEAACRSFCDLALATIETSGIFRVALSGGSTPKRLYQLLSTQSLSWDKIELFWGDERSVPHDHDDSNFKMVKQALLDPAMVPEASFFPVPTTIGSPAEVAAEYERILKAQFHDTDGDGDGEKESPEFDLVLLGMGDDAHTASLFPETDAIGENRRWFVSNWVAKLETYRYTLTAPAINTAANVWFLITGENKQQALANVWGAERNVARFPSQLIEPEDGVLWWMVSQEALPS